MSNPLRLICMSTFLDFKSLIQNSDFTTGPNNTVVMIGQAPII